MNEWFGWILWSRVVKWFNDDDDNDNDNDYMKSGKVIGLTIEMIKSMYGGVIVEMKNLSLPSRKIWSNP